MCYVCFIVIKMYLQKLVNIMNLLNSKLYSHFKEKKAVKVIAGINNTKISEIVKIAYAAQLANVSYLDVCANTELVKLLKSLFYLPICVSSIEPIDIYNCVVAGADIVEVGNYDSFYSKGIYISSNDIIELVKEIKSLIQNTIICVTIPYYLSLNDQISLAQSLESMNVNLLQTEGIYYSSHLKSTSVTSSSQPCLCCSNKLSASLLSTFTIAKSVNLPIISASGVTDIFTAYTRLYGASGVGIGSAIYKKKSLIEMIKYINQVKSSLINSQNIYINV